MDLKDKITVSEIGPQQTGAPAAPDPINKEVRQEAISALTMLGFSPVPTSKVVTEILRQQPNLPVEQVVKLALKQIK